METYFAFTDECGSYQKNRSDKFLRAHPFYVRATVIVSLKDFLEFQDGMDKVKKSLKVPADVEIKWAHIGSILKGNKKHIPHNLTAPELKSYFQKIFQLACSLKSMCVYYTLTDNSLLGHVDEVNLIKMHLQNALQNVQRTMESRNAYAVVIADDLNDKTRTLKTSLHNIMLEGDYVKYKNIKKGLYVDLSDQCQGLQLADIFAGAFTALLKYESSIEKEKHKFEWAYQLFFQYAYTRTRNTVYQLPYYEVYKYGVKEVPNKAGTEIARRVSGLIEDKMERDLTESLWC